MNVVRALPALALTTLISSSPHATADDERPVVAVFDVQCGPRVQLPQPALDGMAEYISSRLTESARYQIVPRDQLKERLVQEKADSFKACYDQSCQIEVGKELAAEKTLATRIVKLGKRCTVSLTFYDLGKAATESATTQHGGCEEDEVVASLDKALDKALQNAPQPPQEPAQQHAEAPTRVDKPDPAPTGVAENLAKAKLVITTEPTGGRVFIDGKELGFAPLEQAVPSGSLALKVRLKAHYPAVQQLTLKPGEERTLALSLKQEPPDYGGWGHITFWSGLGVAVAGAFFMNGSINLMEDYNNGDEDAKETSDWYAAIAIGGFVVGGALMVTGSVLWIIESGIERPEDDDAVQMGIAPTPGGAAFSIQGRF